MRTNSFIHDPSTRSRSAWVVLRLTLAGLIAAHGWVRFLDGGVVPFGEWLVSQGFPFGFSIAAAITAVEIFGTPVFAVGRLVAPLSLLYSVIYLAGIALVHAKAGWFVVGAGRNGAEYSVLLIASLLCVGLQHFNPRRHA
ncbi:MAG: DoxX family protein [Dechloromonas sp.]|nr:MAG: DoxX family protein [Dechloromonas sp.]